MRILFATYSMAFQNPGGGERVLQSLKSSVEALGHEVTLYHAWKHDPAEFEVIHYFSTVERSCWRAFKRAAPQVPLCVTPVFHSPMGWRGSLFSAKLKISDRFFSFLESSDGFISDLKIPDCLFPTTPSEALVLQKLGVSQQKITVLPNGIGPGFLSADSTLFRTASRIEGPFALHVGRFHPVKNHFTLLRVAKKTKGQFVFIGSPDIDQKDYYDSVIEEAKKIEKSDSSGSTRIHILPALSNENPLLHSAFAAASVFVMPSLFETFGITALEAAVSGTPVIFSKTFQSLKWFESFGTPVDPKDVNTIARFITQGLYSPKIAIEERKRLNDQFCWSTIANQLVKKYQELTGYPP